MNLKNYKILYQIFNFFMKGQLKHNIPFYKKYGLNKKYFSSISSEDFRKLKSPLNIYDLNDSALEMQNNKEFRSLNMDIQSDLTSWSKNGYVILNNFFTQAEVNTCNEEINKLIKNKTLKFKYRNKIMFAFHHSGLIQKMGTDDRLLKILEIIMGKKVDLFQSINFLEGSQQRTHSDSIHMTTFPYGNLIAVWVALEDITVESGPLHYYPGSHKLPYIMNRDYDNIGTKFKLGTKTYSNYEDCIEKVVIDNKLEKKTFLAKKGDILIWHANLLHGGENVLKKESSRKSMVFHYYSEDSICFHEITQRPTLKRKLTKPKLH